MKVFVLTSRYGCDMNGPLCFTEYLEAHETMEADFNTILECAGEDALPESNCGEWGADIFMKSDGDHEWCIDEFDLGEDS